MSQSPWIDASLEQQAILDQVQVRLVERTELESFKQLLKLLGERGLVVNLGIQARLRKFPAPVYQGDQRDRT
jgi:hypothetical protein